MGAQKTKHDEPITSVLTGPLVWRAADLKEQDWLFRLDDACLKEIDSAVLHHKRHRLPIEMLDAKRFDMPCCQIVMSKVRDALVSGCGFALVDRLPMDRLSQEDAKLSYWLLSSMISRPVAQKLDGTMIYDVQDTGKKAVAGSGVRPDKTNIDLTFHNDNSYNNPMPDFVGLLCLKPAKRGGVSRVMSFETAHNALLKSHPDVLPRLYEPFIFDRQREHLDEDPPTISEPVFENNGGLTARLGIHQVRNGYEMQTSGMDDATRAAISSLEKVFADPDLQFHFTMTAGQFQYVNNKVIGHSRTEFEDFEELENRRHLIRLWMRDVGDRSYTG
ncbi:MAG: TauD/TfdA family dioxygenase [Alphaproteobacteria bacterium]|nr:TauD/TfdA family dioxygenase [Alphaproteobacteria bacterium]